MWLQGLQAVATAAELGVETSWPQRPIFLSFSLVKLTMVGDSLPDSLSCSAWDDAGNETCEHIKFHMRGVVEATQPLLGIVPGLVVIYSHRSGPIAPISSLQC